jgi:multifunctional beta-oxidation protein
VVINDVNKQNADQAAQEIKATGGSATANYDTVTNGKAIIDQVIRRYGRIDVCIANAGILRDKSFAAMTLKEFHDVQEVHVKGSFAVAHAAWPHMRKQKFGRLIFVGPLSLTWVCLRMRHRPAP